MPGISFLYDLKGDLIQRESAILRALGSMIHTKQYDLKILLREKTYLLAYTSYEEYPIISFENEESHIYLEGKIYDRENSLINKELSNLAEGIFRMGYKSQEQLSNWLLNVDGDFIVFILNKRSDEIAIINNTLGRLPLYYYKVKGRLILSREVQFISNLVDNEFDKMAIAQYLLFGYCLGKRTLLENTYRLEPATLMTINIKNSEIEIDRLYEFNFEMKKYSGINIHKNADELESSFYKACKNRTNSINKNILSMSGGLDSRSVGACLYKNNIPFYGVTCLDFNKTFNFDVKIAGQLADVFNIDWKVFPVPAPTGRDLLKLLRIKNGLNYLGMSFILAFFDKVKETYGSRVTWFTGDGGDKLLTDLRPSRSLKDLDDLVKYIISENKIFSLASVVDLVQVQEREITDELKDQLLSYPEKEWNKKYIHFVIYERVLKWLFEGEDRNRLYFWSVAPFYSIQFFIYAMNCPDEQKTDYGLYREFLLKLSPEAAAIDNANWKLPIISKRYKTKLLIRSILHSLPSTIRRNIKGVIKHTHSYDKRSNFINCLREQLSNCEYICNYLSNSAIQNIIKNCTKYSKQEMETLFTITSYIEKLKCRESTIEKYYDSDFI